MITGILCFFGGMVGAILINYVLHEPDSQIEEHLYRNSGHHGPED